MLVALLALSLAHGTGLPPRDTVRVVDADCADTATTGGPLWVTFDRVTGVCAPRPDGPPCSTWVDAHLDASALVVRRPDCEQPLPGRFVPDGACDGSPRWRWKGRLDAGHAHDVARDFAPAMARVTVPGEATAACPAVAPPTDPVQTAVVATGPQAPQWVSFPADDYRVDGAALVWSPGPMLRQWLLGDPAAVLRSDPLDAPTTLRARARTTPTGLAVRHQIVAAREWHEGHTQRGVLRCWRVLEYDVEQRLQLDADGEALGPPMHGTARLRQPAEGARCAP